MQDKRNPLADLLDDWFKKEGLSGLEGHTGPIPPVEGDLTQTIAKSVGVIIVAGTLLWQASGNAYRLFSAMRPRT